MLQGFVAQFGINGDPAVQAKYRGATMKVQRLFIVENRKGSSVCVCVCHVCVCVCVARLKFAPKIEALCDDSGSARVSNEQPCVENGLLFVFQEAGALDIQPPRAKTARGPPRGVHICIYSPKVLCVNCCESLWRFTFDYNG